MRNVLEVVLTLFRDLLAMEEEEIADALVISSQGTWENDERIKQY